MSILFLSKAYGKTAFYRDVPAWRPFEDAENYCRNKSAHLVSIHSDAENEFVNQVLKEAEERSLSASVVELLEKGKTKVWIGLKQVGNSVEDMSWTDGSPYDFANWAWGEPKNSHTVNAAYMLASPDPDPLQSEVPRRWYVGDGDPSWKEVDTFVCKRKAQRHITEKI
ncbi:lectin C-type domain protein [Ancylostoma ceylanicum]|uniref:Lectin C-type domain protein n=1 Tax=Ancylostoma ceylanicum TaxID=53326 RepID=A0A0D6LQ41_9BILA|nr:lectin C-type domain protein [Ancylostoma ceylanicum]